MPSEHWNESRVTAHDAAARGAAGTSALPEADQVIAGLRATITAPGIVSMLTPEGEFTPHPDFDLDVTAELVRGLYRDLVLVRRADREGNALQRQGQLGLWVPLLGQEAAQIGAGRALRPQDMVFPSYREHAVAWCRDIRPAQVASMFRGTDYGGWDPKDKRFHKYTVVIGNQALNAAGYAMGQRLDGVLGDEASAEATIVFFGDGATAQGDIHEAMVFAAAWNAPLVFFCQNNQWAISHPIDAVSRVPLFYRAAAFGFPGLRVDGNDVLATLAATRWALDECRTGNGPVMIEAFTYRMDAHTTSDDPNRYRMADETQAWTLLDPIERVKAFLARTGMGDAEFFAEVQAEADQVAAEFRSELISLGAPPVSTMFRNVYAEPNAQLDRQQAELESYLAGFADAEPGALMATLTLAKALNTALREAMDADNKVLVMGEDVGRLGGVFRITDGLQKDFGEHRVMDTPLAESGIVGTALGLAMRGYRPVVEIQFDGFVFPAFDQIISQVAKVGFRTGGSFLASMVIRIPFGGGIGAVEHHSESPESFFCHIAGLRVVACSNPSDGYHMLRAAIACDDPVIFLEPKRRYWEKGEVVTASHRGDYFSTRLVRSGTDCTVVTYGPSVPVAMAAAEVATSEGRSLEVLDLRSLSPLDLDPVLDSVRRTGHLVVVSEAPRESSITSEIAARVSAEAFYSLEAPVVRVAGFDTPYPPSKLEEEYLPSLDRILEAVDRCLGAS